MDERTGPELRTNEDVLLVGAMSVYGSQSEASKGIPGQWRDFLRALPTGGSGRRLCGASPCTDDGKIHYLTGVAQGDGESPLGGEQVTLEAGEYAVMRVEDPALLRETWGWLLGTWLPGSGRRERRAPEFEQYSGISPDGLPVGLVELWIPLEPFAGG